MINRLSIQNLILIEKAEILFDQGLQIITGETGSGKSVLLGALRLLLGAKADGESIRSGASVAAVEAELTISQPLSWLEEEGISVPSHGSVLIRREIHRSGKNRCFFEEQQIPLALLKKITSGVIELVDQGSASSLSSAEAQRKWLDAFGGLSLRVQEFGVSFNKEKELTAKLQQLKAEKETVQKELEKAQEDVKILDEVDVQDQEEEKLTEEHNVLTHAQALEAAAASTLSLLSESQEPLIPLLKRAAHNLEHLVSVDSRLTETAGSIKRSALELEEAVFFLRSYVDRLEANPRRLLVVEERLAQLEKLKKRFGSLSQLRHIQDALFKQLNRPSELEEIITSTDAEIKILQKYHREEAQRIGDLRREAAFRFSIAITEELLSLNLPHARFEASISPKPISSHGTDEVSFLFSANPGYPPLPLEECASGGELSRVFLAIKTVLTEQDQSSCLIFDEIDSNVGGQTAAILGEKLQTLAKKRQIICVTHFVQVAKYASHHFLVSKNDALTTVQRLNAAQQEIEFDRMLGKK
jgi:ATPase involved in DNA repair